MSRSRFNGNSWLPALALLLAACVWSRCERADRLENQGQLRLAVSQDNVTWRLAHRGTFTIDLNDQAWREQLTLSPQETKSIESWARFNQGQTTRIAPLFPVLSAATYRLVGYRPPVVFWLQNVFNALTLAALLFVARRFVTQAWGIAVATLGLMLDPYLWWNSQRFVVNDLSVGIVALLAAATFLAVNKRNVFELHRVSESEFAWSRSLLGGLVRSPWWWVGICLGLEFLNRPTSQFWALWLMLVWPWLLVSWGVSGRPKKAFLQGSGLVACGFLLIALPWVLRNTSIVGWLAPGGVDPWIQINGGYQHRTANQLGRVWPTISQNQENSVSKSRLYQELDNLQREVILAQICLGNTITWISREFDHAPRLFVLKLLDHFGLVNQKNYASSMWHGLLLILAIRTCVVQRATWGVAVGGVLILSGLTIGLTWSDGCFLAMPLRGLIVLAAAVGFGDVVSTQWFYWRKVTATSQS